MESEVARVTAVVCPSLQDSILVRGQLGIVIIDVVVTECIDDIRVFQPHVAPTQRGHISLLCSA